MKSENKLIFIQEVDPIIHVGKSGVTKGRKRFIKRGLYQCSCGNTCIKIIRNVKTKLTSSCGCLKPYKNIRNHPLFVTWYGMKQRCRNSNNDKYKNYGSRGIIVCDRWLGIGEGLGKGFRNFYTDMGPRPTPKHSIDRIDNDGPYSPDNCRWATQKEQNNNRRNNIYIEYEGERKCIEDWAKIKNLSPNLIRSRIYSGWSENDAINKPYGYYKDKGIIIHKQLLSNNVSEELQLLYELYKGFKLGKSMKYINPQIQKLLEKRNAI